jgi:5'(3')-deoxyribonucleotidase
MTDRVGLIDLDGTVADYDKSLTAIMNTLRAPHEPEYKGRNYPDNEEPHIEARRKLIQKQPGFWRNLSRHPLGFELVEVLRSIGYELVVLTKGPRSASSAWAEKCEWREAHLPDAKLIISEDKSLVYGRCLIDDYIPYAEPWLQKRPRGIVIAVAQPWNADFRHDRFYRYDGNNLSQIREVLQKAYDR